MLIERTSGNAAGGGGSTGDIVLRTEDLTKRFGKRTAVENLNIEVHRGDVYGFLGPNGAGKSTTIRMALSLIKPTEGRVHLFEKDVTRHREVLGRIGGMVERPDFYNYLSGSRNLEIVSALYGRVDKRRIHEVLAIVGLADRGNDRVKSYSHGMKQRLGIAQALLANPEFLILDEPTNGLDPHGMKEVRDLIRRLNAEQNMTIFLSSHLLNEIEQVATRMCILHKGRLIAQGRVSDLLNREEVTVHIQAAPLEKAQELLRTFEAAKDIAITNGEIVCTVLSERLAACNSMLVGAGVHVSAFSPRRSLEDYFLSITMEVEKP